MHFVVCRQRRAISLEGSTDYMQNTVWANFKVSSVKPGGKRIDHKALNVQKRNGVSWQHPELFYHLLQSFV